MSSPERSLARQAAISHGGSTRVWPFRSLIIAGIEIALVILTGILAALLVWTLLSGSYRTPLPALAAFNLPAADRNAGAAPAGSAAGLFARGSAAAIVQIETLPESRLGFALFGVRTASDPQAGSAIIEAGAGGQRSIPAGQELQPGITLEEVHADRVVLNRRGAREVVYLTERARQQAASSVLAPVTIAGVTLIPQALTSGGQGLKVDGAPGPLGTLGIRTDDIIASIDGQALSAPLIASLASRMAQGEMPASLTLERDGERLTLQTRPNP